MLALALATMLAVAPNTYLVGGSTCEADKATGYVYFLSESLDYWYFCSATLVDQDWVLTSAHCADFFYLWPDTTAVYGAGETLTAPLFEVSIDEVAIHPDWDTEATSLSDYANDLALLHLESPVAAEPYSLSSPPKLGLDFDIKAYGNTALRANDYGTLRCGVGEIYSVDAISGMVSFRYTRDSVGACSGDAGAGLLNKDLRTVGAVVAIGEPTNPRTPCYTGITWATPLDLNWIMTVIAN